jgi:carboxyl-terminal processing protease
MRLARVLLVLVAVCTFLCPPGLAQQDPGTYADNFEFAWRELGQRYPFFQLKSIDWQAVHAEFEPRFQAVTTDQDFVRELREMVCRLRDGHSGVSSQVEVPYAEERCIGARLGWTADNRVVVVNVDPDTTAAQVGLAPGMIVTQIDGRDAFTEMEARAKAAWERGWGTSSPQRSRMWEYRYMPLHGEPGTTVPLVVEAADGAEHPITLTRDAGYGYPRIYAAPPDLQHAGYASYTVLAGNVGYLHLRNIQSVRNGPTAPEQLDKALGALAGTTGLVLDLRGNGGGGYDEEVLKRFPSAQMVQAGGLPPTAYTNPIVVIADAGTFSAGETFVTYFIAALNAPVVGETTAGSSSAKASIALPNGLAQITYSTRSRSGHWGKGIEFTGVAPTVEVHVDPQALAEGRDNFIEKAVEVLGGLG